MGYAYHSSSYGKHSHTKIAPLVTKITYIKMEPIVSALLPSVKSALCMLKLIPPLGVVLGSARMDFQKWFHRGVTALVLGDVLGVY